MVICRLDYCNAALAGLSQATVAPLQRVQNSAARLIFKLSSPEHATPCLLQLHWLASTLAHPVQTVLRYALSFLRDVSGVSDYTSLSLLVPVVHVPASVPRRRPTTRGHGCAQSSLNVRSHMHDQLPEDLRAVADTAEFRKELKTHLFTAVKIMFTDICHRGFYVLCL